MTCSYCRRLTIEIASSRRDERQEILADMHVALARYIKQRDAAKGESLKAAYQIAADTITEAIKGIVKRVPTKV